MKLLVVGGGGREHAIIKKLKENPAVEQIFALPGNGGMAADATCVDIGAKDIPAIVDFAVAQGIDYAVVAPDDPLVLGCVDALEEKGIPCFGPVAKAAEIESSKAFSKNLMKKYNIPNPQTADGPAGIRRSVNCTCFPCGTLMACSWDAQLQYRMGKAMGYEGYHTEMDILLGPSMNIHRNPLGGRNFEYLSEDPLVTGKTAAAIIQGIQSEGLCATVKQLVANKGHKLNKTDYASKTNKNNRYTYQAYDCPVNFALCRKH